VGSASRGMAIRTLSARLGPTVSIPSALKQGFRDGCDAQVVLEVKRHKPRLNLAVSSGGELVIPEYLQELVPRLALDQKVDEVTFYLSRRPLTLVKGEQDDVIRSVCSPRNTQTAWERLDPSERRDVALRWIKEELESRGA
jgi:hypothetical protein